MICPPRAVCHLVSSRQERTREGWARDGAEELEVTHEEAGISFATRFGNFSKGRDLQPQKFPIALEGRERDGSHL